MDDRNAEAIYTLAAYPAAIHAVSFCELHLDDQLWACMRQGGPALAMELLQDVLAEAVQEQLDHLTRPRGRSYARIKYREALAELHTPDFARYLAAKLGAL